jgi:hypothetical protein
MGGGNSPSGARCGFTPAARAVLTRVLVIVIGAVTVSHRRFEYEYEYEFEYEHRFAEHEHEIRRGARIDSRE